MLGRTAWRVRTRLRELSIRLGGVEAAGAPVLPAPLLADLWFELQSQNPEVVRAVAEIQAALRGLAVPAGPAHGAADGRALLDEVRWAFEVALGSGELVIEELRAPPQVPVLVEPAAEAEPAAEDAWETTFIVIETHDEDDAPVGCRFRIELPNGEVREGHTGGAGRARVDGIVGGGTAKVTFPELDEQAVALSS